LNQLTTKQKEIVRFALSFLMANIDDAYEGLNVQQPSIDDIDEVYKLLFFDMTAPPNDPKG
jgi:hypothetical protein